MWSLSKYILKKLNKLIIQLKYEGNYVWWITLYIFTTDIYIPNNNNKFVQDYGAGCNNNNNNRIIIYRPDSFLFIKLSGYFILNPFSNRIKWWHIINIKTFHRVICYNNKIWNLMESFCTYVYISNISGQEPTTEVAVSSYYNNYIIIYILYNI